jgi:tRNA-splicing ligase RtcB
MRVDGIIYADDGADRGTSSQDKSPEQVANVACLPGIVGASLAMPDIHWGYGFCIGGVAATDPAEGGVISPGGVGYDINCGVRLVRTDLTHNDVQPRIEKLVNRLFAVVPCGVGQGGRIKFERPIDAAILSDGARYVVDEGYGWESDLECTEAHGCLPDADPDRVSQRAFDRGRDQCGTLGSGNHFLEVQVVEEIADEEAARAFGLELGQVTVMIHSGSRGLGYQVCEDALQGAARRAGEVRHRAAGQAARVRAGALAGRRALPRRDALRGELRVVEPADHDVPGAAGVRGRLRPVAGGTRHARLVYDVAHNIAKMEEYEIDGRMRTLCVHRKGATRAFPAQHPEVPEPYRHVGQPVLVPGDMGRSSWVLVGPAGRGGADVRELLPRGRPADVAQGRDPRGGQAADRRGAAQGRRDRAGAGPDRARRRAAGCVQGRRPGRGGGACVRAQPQGRTPEAGRGNQGLNTDYRIWNTEMAVSLRSRTGE